jgi:hypothetical protein
LSGACCPEPYGSAIDYRINAEDRVIQGLSRMTFIVGDLNHMGEILTSVFDTRLKQ